MDYDLWSTRDFHAVVPSIAAESRRTQNAGIAMLDQQDEDRRAQKHRHLVVTAANPEDSTSQVLWHNATPTLHGHVVNGLTRAYCTEKLALCTVPVRLLQVQGKLHEATNTNAVPRTQVRADLKLLHYNPIRQGLCPLDPICNPYPPPTTRQCLMGATNHSKEWCKCSCLVQAGL